jgi:hypothetical protein
MIPVQDAVERDLSRIIHRAYREAEANGDNYDTATGAAARAVRAVYPNWSREQVMDQILRFHATRGADRREAV